MSELARHHAAEDILVCGCGESLNELRAPASCVTIGVNDVGRLFDPTYLVVVNPRAQFRLGRFRYVEQSRARALFTQLDLGRVGPPVVKFKLGEYAGTEIGTSGALHYTQNSPYLAVCLAAYLGAGRIGLLGVDFTDHHFFAQTGRHALSARLQRIDAEYGALAQALARRGVQLVNCSPTSRLQSLPRCALSEFTPTAHAACPAPTPRPVRLFVVNHRYLACGSVFADGLRHAASELGLPFADAHWDDPELPRKVEAFAPDLLLVVHGRHFARRWRGRFARFKKAVWLTEEPYEVDDTSRWSGAFDFVFSNDASSLARHRAAHYLPVCFDPQVHRGTQQIRTYRTGFIGAASAEREHMLSQLAQAGLLDYVVGGPWRSPLLRRLCLADKIPPARTAELYRLTEIVINIFRRQHQFNARQLPALAMNPRVYEALACGALVVSERRAEIADVFCELPQFDAADALVATVAQLLSDRAQLAELRDRSLARLHRHSYGDRLRRILEVCAQPSAPAMHPPVLQGGPVPATRTAQVSSTAPTAREPAGQRTRLPVRPLHSAKASGLPAGRGAPLPRLPFTHGAVRRNLLYHVWPVRGGTWRWNLDQLKQRIDLFNGRRVIGIVCDQRSEPAEAVQAYLAGHGCEYVIADNDGRGEACTFPKLLERVASTREDEVSFYAHAKGVKYEPAFPSAIRRWSDAQYSVLLDDWRAIKAALETHALTGMFRRFGRFPNHHNQGAWHYSGTFFWLRHAHVFQRDWREVPQFYGGVEAWPGIHFEPQEASCLMFDQLRAQLYDERFWAQRGDAAIRDWRTKRAPVPVPPDLANPTPLAGHSAPRLEQKPAEFDFWLERLYACEPERVLTIGSRHGGEEWHMARICHELGRKLAISALTPHESSALREACADAQRRFGVPITVVVADSSAPDLRARLAPHYDAAFIDGDHSYRGARHDFELARSLGARLIGFHDIVDSDWHAAHRCCVSRLWTELQRDHAHAQLAGGEWGGIGIVTLDGQRAGAP